MKTEYTVRGYLLSQHVMPHVKMQMQTKEMAIALAEVLLEDKFHYVTIMNHYSDEEVIEMKNDLVLEN